MSNTTHITKLTLFNPSNFKNIIICFDDFERLSHNISLKDVMGLISQYDRQMRITNLKQIFTNLPSKDIKLINRNELFQKINHIRNFRNRIFYHEKIVNNTQYENIEIQIEEILEYLHVEILSFLKRVNHVH